MKMSRYYLKLMWIYIIGVFVHIGIILWVISINGIWQISALFAIWFTCIATQKYNLYVIHKMKEDILNE